MYTGRVPLLTKGPLVTFYGREELLEEVSADPPGLGITVLFVSSLTFQVVLFLFKWNFSRKIPNYQNYALNLRTTLVNNVLNIYGVMIIMMISLISCFYAIYHYLSIKNLNKLTEAETETNVMPTGLLLIYLITFFVVLLPFIQNFALRSFKLCSNLVKYLWSDNTPGENSRVGVPTTQLRKMKES